MKRLMITGAVVVGIVLLARRAASQCQNIDWEQRLAAMPDNAPPKWMFRNITEIRDNTARILELIESRPAAPVETREEVPTR